MRASKMPSLATASLRVFDVSLGEMLWSRRTVFLALVVGGPVLIAIILRVVDALNVPAMRVNGVQLGGPSIFGLMIWFLFLRFIVPVLGIFYGTSLMADEVEDKTITYLFTRPIPRSAVLIGKYLAYLASTVLIVLPSVMLVYFLVVPIGGGAIAVDLPDPAARPGRCWRSGWRSMGRCLRPWAPGSSARCWLAFSSPSAGRTSPWPCRAT